MYFVSIKTAQCVILHRSPQWHLPPRAPPTQAPAVPPGESARQPQVTQLGVTGFCKSLTWPSSSFFLQTLVLNITWWLSLLNSISTWTLKFLPIVCVWYPWQAAGFWNLSIYLPLYLMPVPKNSPQRMATAEEFSFTPVPTFLTCIL